MSTRIPLTLACGDYEIIRPLKEGTVRPDGIDLTVLTAMDSTTRHWRFLRGQEFDAAEVSCSSYIVARDQGLAATAIPVFLHRRFRHGFVFINTTKGIKKPSDLVGSVRRARSVGGGIQILNIRRRVRATLQLAGVDGLLFRSDATSGDVA